MANEALGSFLANSRTLIENARGLVEISETLAGYGYDAARFDEGAALWEAADSLAKAQAKEHGEKLQASADFDAAWEKANSAYMKTLKLARIAFQDKSAACSALKLYGPRRQSVEGWLDQASVFYANLKSDQAYMDSLSRYAYTSRKIATESALVEEVRTSLQAQAKESGEARTATAERDKKVKQLDAWVSELKTVAKIAFHERPLELEKLGLRSSNGSRKKTKAGETAAKADKGTERA
jgi:hypothetical protein